MSELHVPQTSVYFDIEVLSEELKLESEFSTETNIFGHYKKQIRSLLSKKILVNSKSSMDVANINIFISSSALIDCSKTYINIFRCIGSC
jgi:hypothetical protein